MQSKVSIWMDIIFLRHHISSQYDWYANWNGLFAEGCENNVVHHQTLKTLHHTRGENQRQVRTFL